jgi:hypothetical protein
MKGDLGDFPTALAAFKGIVKGLKPDDTISFKVSDLEQFMLESLVEATKKYERRRSSKPQKHPR